MDTDTNHALDSLLDKLEQARLAHEARIAAAPHYAACPHHGEHAAALVKDKLNADGSLRYSCPQCRADKLRIQRVSDLRERGIPLDALHATLGNFETDRPGISAVHHSPKKFLASAEACKLRQVRNLFLCGSPGIGKGHLAAALCIDAHDAGRSFAWTTCLDLFKDYHDAYSDNSTDSIVGHYGGVSLLVLDELCLRTLPADGEEILFSIFDLRHKRGKQTIMLGNKSAEDTRQWLGARIVDRLRSGGVIFCYGEWQSMRGREGDGSGEEF